MLRTKRFVYILKTDRHPARFYTGVTSDVSARLVADNEDSGRAVSIGVTETQVQILAVVTKEQAQVWLDDQGTPEDDAEGRGAGGGEG